MEAKSGSVEKLSLGIPGFDQISLGGVPKNRTTLVTGTVGSGKTVFAAQFLAEGIRHTDENGIFVTLEEAPSELCKNLASFGWDIEAWEAEGKWLFVDASPQSEEIIIGSTHLDARRFIVLLRYAEVKGAMQRALTVLKMRGSDHDKSIRRFTIDNAGMHIADPISNVIGILTGNFRLVTNGESQVTKAA